MRDLRRIGRVAFAALWFCAVVCGFGPSACSAGELSIVTSYPASFYEPVRQAFELLHPDVRLRISNRKTTSAIASILDRSREPADVFWASSPDAFVVLEAAGRLARLPANYPRPLKIGAVPADDPNGFYAGFAISGYGIVWNTPVIAERGVAAPTSIAGLADPAYAGMIGMTTPARSGTTHLMVETVLQSAGWDVGWATWAEIGGNLATLMARSYSVGFAASQGRVPIGLSIDFLGRTSKSDEGVRFAYPPENVFLPASVAILADAKSRREAETFIAYLMSREGQKLLSSPAIGRLPIDPTAYGDASTDPYRIASSHSRSFDAGLSGQRYELVNLLFDEAVTYRLPALQAIWRRVHEAEAKAESGARGRLAEVRRLLTAMPVSDAESRDPGFSADLKRTPWGVTPSLRQAALVAEWRSFFEDHITRADRLLDETVASPEGRLP